MYFAESQTLNAHLTHHLWNGWKISTETIVMRECSPDSSQSSHMTVPWQSDHVTVMWLMCMIYRGVTYPIGMAMWESHMAKVYGHAGIHENHVTTLHVCDIKASTLDVSSVSNCSQSSYIKHQVYNITICWTSLLQRGVSILFLFCQDHSSFDVRIYYWSKLCNYKYYHINIGVVSMVMNTSGPKRYCYHSNSGAVSMVMHTSKLKMSCYHSNTRAVSLVIYTNRLKLDCYHSNAGAVSLVMYTGGPEMDPQHMWTIKWVLFCDLLN